MIKLTMIPMIMNNQYRDFPRILILYSTLNLIKSKLVFF
jgi:hypothetical protein